MYTEHSNHVIHLHEDDEDEDARLFKSVLSNCFKIFHLLLCKLQLPSSRLNEKLFARS